MSDVVRKRTPFLNSLKQNVNLYGDGITGFPRNSPLWQLMLRNYHWRKSVVKHGGRDHGGRIIRSG